MPHTVKIAKAGKSDKGMKWELKKLKKCGGSWWKKSGEKVSISVKKVGIMSVEKIKIKDGRKMSIYLAKIISWVICLMLMLMKKRKRKKEVVPLKK